MRIFAYIPHDRHCISCLMIDVPAKAPGRLKLVFNALADTGLVVSGAGLLSHVFLLTAGEGVETYAMRGLWTSTYGQVQLAHTLYDAAFTALDVAAVAAPLAILSLLRMPRNG